MLLALWAWAHNGPLVVLPLITEQVKSASQIVPVCVCVCVCVCWGDHFGESLLSISCSITSLKIYDIHCVLWGSKVLAYCPLIFNHQGCWTDFIDVVWETKSRKSAQQHYLKCFIIPLQTDNPVPFFFFLSVDIQGQGTQWRPQQWADWARDWYDRGLNE